MLTAGSRQFVEQRLRLFEIGRVEAFGEPAVDRREKVAGFGVAALVAAEVGKAHGGPQFPELRPLSLSYPERLVKHCFSRGWISVLKQMTATPHQLRLKPILPAVSRSARCFHQYTQRDVGVTPYTLSLGLQSLKLRH